MALQVSLDLAFEALADPNRRRIVEQLVRGPRTVSELAAPFAMSLPAVTHHLRKLEQSGLIRSAKRGRVRTCSIEPKALGRVEEWMASRRSDWEQRLGRLDAYLAAPASSDSPAIKGKKR
jgi:DNA-binding transcriptional ArsR family regulator